MRRPERWRATAALVLALAVPARAQAPEAFAGAALPPAVRAELARRAAWWQAGPPERREAFRARVRAWDALPAAERAARRERAWAWRLLPPGERARVLAALERFHARPPAEQQALRARFDALDARERRGWLLGPELGADYAALQPLLAQVPAAEHAPLLRTLRAMGREERAMLAVLAQRTPPQGRDALRRRLIALPPPRHAAWLAQELAR